MSGNKPSTPIVLRVLEEHKELVTKILALEAFLGGASGHITAHDRDLLIEQLECMRAYRGVLIKRLKYWGII